ncbi:MAG: DUF2232 domain-containing protein [Nitrospirae bacterium]|nr:DUF2232 domain-containing protein [Nitrospirota bacterium]
MPNGKKFPWIEIAIITVFSFFLISSIYYRNWTGFAVSLFSFTPLILSYLHFPKKVFVSISFMLVFAFFLFFERYEALFLISTYLFSSIIIGEMIQKKRPAEQIVLAGILPPFVSGTAMWFYQAVKSHTKPLAYSYQVILQNLKETILYYEKIGMDKEKIDYLNASLNDMATVIFYLFPSVYLIGLIFIIFLNFLLTRFILMKMETPGVQFNPLTSWFASDSLVWGLIGSGALVIVPSAIAKVIGGNLLILFMLLYFFQGLALMSDFFKRKEVRLFWQVLSYMMLLIWPLLGAAVALLGLFDIWIDFRKVRT